MTDEELKELCEVIGIADICKEIEVIKQEIQKLEKRKVNRAQPANDSKN